MPADQPASGGTAGSLAGLAASLGPARGTVIGKPAAFRISPPEEDAFAALIGDWDPMHNDPAWHMAAGDGPIVLGFHSLARVMGDLLACPLVRGACESGQVTVAGLGNVRFPAPFPVGAQAIPEVTLGDIAASGAELMLTTRHRYLLEAAARPVMVADLLTVVTTGHGDPGHGAPGWPGDVDSAAVDIAGIPDGDPVAPSSRYDSAFYSRLGERTGQWLGSTPWTVISDREAHAFALLTGSERAGRTGDLPFLAHPFQHSAVPPLQLLALRAYFSPQVGLPVLTDDSMMAFNYGVDRARWFGSVRAGTRLRDHVRLAGVEPRGPGDFLVTTRHVLEAEGNDVAVLVADCKTLYRTSR
jgi:acyl dehydratase